MPGVEKPNDTKIFKQKNLHKMTITMMYHVNTSADYWTQNSKISKQGCVNAFEFYNFGI